MRERKGLESHAVARATPPPARDRHERPWNSLFGRTFPCSGVENSLFRKVQGIARKPFELQGDFAPTSAPRAENGRRFSKFPDNFPVLREIRDRARPRSRCRTGARRADTAGTSA